jgi:hypothetical protein
MSKMRENRAQRGVALPALQAHTSELTLA